MCVWYCRGKEKESTLPDVTVSGGKWVLRKNRSKKKKKTNMWLKANEVIPYGCPNLEKIQ